MDLRKNAVTFGIAVLFALFVGYSIDAVYEAPDMRDYCNDSYDYMAKPYMPEMARNCTYLEVPPEESKACYGGEGQINFRLDEYGCQKEYYCEYCYKNFNDANKYYNRNVFLITALFGLIAIVAGLMMPATMINEVVGSGFIFGGVLTLFYGTVRYFPDMNKGMRPLVLFVELIVLIVIAYRKLAKK